MVTWYSVYFRSANQQEVAAALRELILTSGYTEFNPFGLMPGRVYRDAVRLFIAPPREGWTRILAEKPISLPSFPLILEASLEGEAMMTRVDGSLVDPVIALAKYECITEALNAPPDPVDGEAAVGGIPFDALPDDVKKMASGVNPRQAGKLFDRLSSSVLGKVGGETSGASNLLKGADWTTPNGQRIQRVMQCLNLTEWRTPDFVTLRDAYALYERRRRNPNATLYPGDAEAMQAVSHINLYLPIYAGRD